MQVPRCVRLVDPHNGRPHTLASVRHSRRLIRLVFILRQHQMKADEGRAFPFIDLPMKCICFLCDSAFLGFQWDMPVHRIVPVIARRNLIDHLSRILIRYACMAL